MNSIKDIKTAEKMIEQLHFCSTLGLIIDNGQHTM